MARNVWADPEPEKPKPTRDRSYKKARLSAPAREPDSVDDGSTPWVNGAPVDAQPLDPETAAARVQQISSGLLSVAEQELRELMQAWRDDVTLAATSMRAIQLVVERAAGKTAEAPKPKQKSTGLEALAAALVEDDE
jgi:hypothetical protein